MNVEQWIGFLIIGIAIVGVLIVVFVVTMRVGRPGPRPTPPPGVHLPPGSLLPVIFSIGAALLGLGLVFKPDEPYSLPVLSHHLGHHEPVAGDRRPAGADLRHRGLGARRRPRVARRSRSRRTTTRRGTDRAMSVATGVIRQPGLSLRWRMVGAVLPLVLLAAWAGTMLVMRGPTAAADCRSASRRRTSRSPTSTAMRCSSATCAADR